MLEKYKHFIFLLILTIVGVLLPLIIRAPYQRHLLVLTIIFGILALSLDVIMGKMGQYSFGHQTFFGMGAYTTAILAVKVGLPVWLCFFAGIFFAGFFGFIVGFISLRKARGVYLAIITLGLGKVTWLIANNWYALTGGNSGVPLVPFISFRVPFAGQIVLENESSYYYFALASLVIIIHVIYVWENSRIGRAVDGIRENEQLASSVGINPFKCYLLAFTFASALAGIAGVIYAHYQGHVAPDTLSMHYMFWMLVMVLVGGMRTFTGPILGAFLFVFLPEWLVAAKEFRMIAFGIIVLICIIFLRQGIVPSLVSLWKNRT